MGKDAHWGKLSHIPVFFFSPEVVARQRRRLDNSFQLLCLSHLRVTQQVGSKQCYSPRKPPLCALLLFRESRPLLCAAVRAPMLIYLAAAIVSNSQSSPRPVLLLRQFFFFFFQKPEQRRFSRSNLLPRHPIVDGVHGKLRLTKNDSFKEVGKMDGPEFKAEICDATLTLIMVATWNRYYC